MKKLKQEVQGKVMETRLGARPRMGNQEEVVTKTEGASGELRTEEYFFSKAVGGVLFALVNSSVLPQ